MLILTLLLDEWRMKATYIVEDARKFYSQYDNNDITQSEKFASVPSIKRSPGFEEGCVVIFQIRRHFKGTLKRNEGPRQAWEKKKNPPLLYYTPGL